jgi:hypothetical protein
MERVCLKCGPKPVSEFGINNTRKDGLQVWCRSCKRTYNTTHYESNKDKYAEQSATYYKSLKGSINQLKESTPCKDCGKFYPHYVMDFDHIEGEKVFNLSKAHAYSKEEIELELAKCEIVCSNCHRERTHKRNTGFV